MIRILRTPTQPPATDKAADRDPTPATPFQATLRAAGNSAHAAVTDATSDATLDPSTDTPKRSHNYFGKSLETPSEVAGADAAAAAAQLAAQASLAATTAGPPPVAAATAGRPPIAAATAGPPPIAAKTPASASSRAEAGAIATVGSLRAGGTPGAMVAAETASPPTITARATPPTTIVAGTASPTLTTGTAAPPVGDGDTTMAAAAAAEVTADDDTRTALGGLATALAHSSNTVVAYRVPASAIAESTGTRAANQVGGGSLDTPQPGRRTTTQTTAAQTAAIPDGFLPGPDFASIADPTTPVAQPNQADATDATDDLPTGVWVAASRAFSALGDRALAASPEVPASGLSAGFDTTALTPLEQAVHDLIGRFTDERAVAEKSTGPSEPGALPAVDPTGEPPLGAVDGFSPPRTSAAQHTTAATPVHTVREAPEPPTNPSHVHLVVDDGPQRVVVTVAMRGNDVHVAMRGSDDTTTSALARNAASLDHAMRARGLSLGELTAEREPAQHDRPRQHHEPQERRRPDAEPFELEETP